MGAELFHVDDGRTDRQTEMKKLIVALRSFANVPRKTKLSFPKPSLFFTSHKLFAVNITVGAVNFPHVWYKISQLVDRIAGIFVNCDFALFAPVYTTLHLCSVNLKFLHECKTENDIFNTVCTINRCIVTGI
jgi:hypothetical protein